jgi:hypothetical protein
MRSFCGTALALSALPGGTNEKHPGRLKMKYANLNKNTEIAKPKYAHPDIFTAHNDIRPFKVLCIVKYLP